MEVEFRLAAIAQMQAFAHNYEEGFVRLYSDTGIPGEDRIAMLYRQASRELLDALFVHVGDRLGREKVLGRKKAGPWYELDFQVGSRLIVAYYSEDRKGGVRWVESVAIDRKPIIF